MFGRVIIESAPALQLLVFFFGLGVVLFGSCIYFMEEGEWHGPDALCHGLYREPIKLCREYGFENGVYLRDDVSGTSKEVSPFSSIVKSFWWVATTCTTVC